MPTAIFTFEQLRSLGETDLGTSDWLTIGQERVNQFADATEDHQWIHVDPARASEGPYGTTVAHGYLTLSLVPRMLEDLLVITDKARGTNYGLDRARFTSPVPVGSQVQMSGRILEVSSRTDGGLQYKVGVAMQVRGQDRPALVAEVIYLVYAA